LNAALAQRVQELLRYRSEFFGKLHEILGNHPDIRVVGDRFVFQSELFFDSGAAVLRQEGRAELDQLATVLLGLDTRIPSKLNWVCASMAIATHGRLPFRLSNRIPAARGISVVQYLISKGVSPRRLVAAGFGEFQPIDPSAIF
jgi:chemotaxis protein MotB